MIAYPGCSRVIKGQTESPSLKSSSVTFRYKQHFKQKIPPADAGRILFQLFNFIF